METPEEIKKAASYALIQEDYKTAYSKLWELGCDSFLNFTLSEKRIKDWLQPDYFWNDFLLKEIYFIEIVSSKKAPELFRFYFKEFKKPSNQLISELFRLFPAFISEQIKENLLFTKSNWIRAIRENKNFINQNDFEVWEFLYVKETQLWEEIIKYQERLNNIDAEEILARVVIWLEEFRYRNGNIYEKDLLSKSYSFFIEKVFSKYWKNKHLTGFDEKEFFRHFYLIICNRTQEEHFIASLMQSIYIWNEFYHNEIIHYSFVKDCNLSLVGKDIRLTFSEEESLKWKNNGKRFDWIEAYYLYLGQELINYKLENDTNFEIPKGRFPIDYEINKSFNINIQAIKYLLKDLAIESFNKYTKAIPIENLISPLIGYSVNRHLRYDKLLEKYSGNSNSYFQAFYNLYQESLKIDVVIEPFIIHTKEEFQNLNNHAIGIEKSTTEILIRNFSVSPGDKFNEDHFLNYYDVNNKPFLDLGNMIFSPIIFFTSFGFYSFIQQALKERKGKRGYESETEKMEQILLEKFKERGWKCFIPDKNKINNLSSQADIDLIVDDGKNALIIQLKRTYFRLSPQEALFERIHTDAVATQQINSAEEVLLKQNEIYTMDLPYKKWYVTTSIENSNSIINDCRKVSYLELSAVLDFFKFRTLQDLIEFIENDRHLKN
jgi:hypothetical protein